MKRFILLQLSFLITNFSYADEKQIDNESVEFFEELYDTEISGVKPINEYSDPDAFYAAIAEQLGIQEKAFKAVEKKFGWKESKDFFLTAAVKGGGTSDDWDVMIFRFPAALKKAKSNVEKSALLKKMQMKMVVIGYDGSIRFPTDIHKSL